MSEKTINTLNNVYIIYKNKSIFNARFLHLPVNAFNPSAQVLSDVHGEGVVVQLVHLLQVFTFQHLKLAPLSHFLFSKWNIC